MTYESPIHLYRSQLNIEIENEVLKAVHKIGVVVDKDELLKALQYDRDQYQKGYTDGCSDTQKWISVKERLPEDEEYVLCWYKDEFGDEWSTVGLKIQWGCGWDLDIDDNSGRNLTVTHWMPLPEPPKEKEK